MQLAPWIVSTKLESNEVGGWTVRRTWSDGFVLVAHGDTWSDAWDEIERFDPEHTHSTFEPEYPLELSA